MIWVVYIALLLIAAVVLMVCRPSRTIYANPQKYRGYFAIYNRFTNGICIDGRVYRTPKRALKKIRKLQKQMPFFGDMFEIRKIL